MRADHVGAVARSDIMWSKDSLGGGGRGTKLKIRTVTGLRFGITTVVLRDRPVELKRWDPECRCFSLILSGRSVDFACMDTEDTIACILGLQSAVRGAKGYTQADLAQRIEAIKAVDTHAVSSLKPWGRNTMQREKDTVKREEDAAGESVAGADSAPESAADAPVALESAAARIPARITAGNAVVTPGWAPPAGNDADMLAMTLARIRTLEAWIEEQQAELQALRAGLRGGAQSAAAPTAAEATSAAEAPVAEVPPLGLLAADGGVQSAVDDGVAL